MAEQKKKVNILLSILVVALIVAAYFIGNLTAKVQYLQKGSAATPAAAGTTPPAGAAAPTITIAQIKDVFKKDVIKFGNANSKLLLVEVSDPSCPYCHIAAGKDSALNKLVNPPQFVLMEDGGTYVPPVPEMKKLLDAGKAAFVYIYDPGHGNGEMAVRAFYCAFEKGKFWEVHDLIMSEKGYEIQNGTDPAGQPATGPVVKNDKTKSGDLATFLAPAIDPAFMKSCLESGKYDARLGADTQLASGLGVQGTPGFFVNATRFAGAYSFKDMQSAVDAALK
ncbi:MAG: DsbA family protein [Candidatus Gottesmanbacteria bacterium]|nr:DsbA family protein [Candidatus Gottesmanbacteria bacterium]